MNEDQTAALSLKAAYAFGASKGLKREVDEIRDMVIEWDSSYTSSLRRGYIVELFEKNGIFDEFKADHWARGNTPAGETKRRRYLKIKKEYEDFLAGRGSETGPVSESEDEDGDQQFAAETDLRDFLAKNLSCVEPGLRLYQVGDRSGVEFAVEGGYIDILAVDRNDRFAVIELKLGRGRNKAVGQLLYYMGWVDKHLGKAPCRGIIIAREIPEDLALTVERVPGLQLYRYSLSVSVELVSQKA
ncbi:MAG: endonuclease NucS domain-containing protein [Gammaproteobacteria bacterium]